jgi:hypothetical protein
MGKGLKLAGPVALTAVAVLSLMSFRPYAGPSATQHKTSVLCDRVGGTPQVPKLAGCIPDSDLNMGQGEMLFTRPPM